MKIGILNCSEIARRRIIPAMKKVDGLSISIICSRDKSRAREYAHEFEIPTYTNNPEHLIGIDAVYISSPPTEHYKWIKYFLNQGVHVLCEKSLTTDQHQTAELIQLADERGLIIMENYAFPYHDQWKWIMAKIGDQAIGDILLVNSTFQFPPRPNPQSDFRYNKSLGGGALYDCGGYPLMIANLLMPEGSTFRSVSQMFYQGEIDVHGNTSLVSTYMTFNLSWGFTSPYKCDLEIVGSKGIIKSEKIFSPKADEVVTVTMEDLEGNVEAKHFVCDHFVNLIKDFKHKCETGDQSHHGYIEGQSQLQYNAKATSIRTIID